ncbi:hypothetical protein LMG3482_05957 [Achromobacter deleyi]|nr:hypothetical protein LMG3481_05339 [Achromobacter deleyi]CAB3926369.1 hypothetical protein LMG3482_05957 [Achromobacter deleyi]
MGIRAIGMALQAGDEVHRRALGALVQPLEEGVLAVGARHAPDDGSRGHANLGAVTGDALAQRFHFQLLQVGHQVQQPGAVGGDVQRGMAQHAAVDQPGQGKLHRRVGRQRRLLEVLVHGFGAGAHADQHLGADGQRDGQAGNRPDGIASADPVAHAEYLAGRHAQRAGRGHVGGHGRQVRGHVGHTALLEPGDGGAGVVQRLGGGEGLGRHHHQAAARVQPRHRIMKGMAVDVGHEADLAALARAAKGLDGQARPPVAAADADMQHGREIGRLVGAAHEVGHARIFADRIFVLPVRLFAGAAGPQRRVPGGLVFGPVDRAAREQRLARRIQPAGAQQRQRGRVQRRRLPLHGQVHAQARGLDHLERARIQRRVAGGLRVRLPFGAVGQPCRLAVGRGLYRKIRLSHRVMLLRTVNGYEVQCAGTRCESPPRCGPGRPRCLLQNAAPPSTWCWTAAPGRSRRRSRPAHHPCR